jgi:hypothetical protein
LLDWNATLPSAVVRAVARVSHFWLLKPRRFSFAEQPYEHSIVCLSGNFRQRDLAHRLLVSIELRDLWSSSLFFF